MIYHIVVAAGSGSRFGSRLPKQFCLLNGQPVVMHAIERLRQAEGEVWLVLNNDHIDDWHEMCRHHGFASPKIIPGGATRWHSVKNAVDLLPADARIASIHDGARPLVEPQVVDALIDAVTSGAPGAIPVTDLTDSVRMVDKHGSHALDRSLLRAAHTPQVFNAGLLRDAYSHPWSPAFTDDASVMEASGYGPFALVPDSFKNIKITRPGDIALAEIYLNGI